MVGLEAEHPRYFGSGEGAASLNKEQVFWCAPGMEVASIEQITFESGRHGFKSWLHHW